MHYDPIKNVFARFIKSNRILRKFFYSLLNLFFLRSWYIRKVLRKIIPEIQNANPNILDAGTGFGQYAYFIAKNFPSSKILAVDIKEDYLKDASEFFQKSNLKNVEFKIEDLTKMNFENEFDLILCVDVMEHIEDDLSVLKNFYSALRQNGYLVINTPSSFGGSDAHNQNEESFIGEHFRNGYSKEELFEKLSRSGFDSFDGFYTYGFWGDKAWRIGIKYPMLLLNSSKLFLLFLPIYYLITLPFFIFLNYLDINSKIDVGTGLIVIAKK
ncbi:MAG: class I SAM-dependent methyltransferase [Ignavibacteria bacterium]|nr:class I SAM-dependent methyltransferase [Ignavibacteria bacterium]MDH7527114.1 class I SAM-dependent methyltransferase [Ignavibacteria bacterium]